MKLTPVGHAERHPRPAAVSNKARPGPGISGPVGVDAVPVVTNLDPYLSLKALSSAGGLSVRNLRARLTDPAWPLPHYRVDGKILVRWSAYVTWIERFKQCAEPLDIEGIVADALRGILPE